MESFTVQEQDFPFSTDLYHLTMAAAYWANRFTEPATFELYFRRLPPNRSFVIAAGLEQALHYIQQLRFTEEQITWLKAQTVFKNIDSGFFDYLKSFRFSGEVWGVAEGIPIFPLEPLLQVRAPIIEAQLLETYLLSLINFESLIASKAIRVVLAARGKQVVDFGMRRAHGPQAGLLAARASYIGGCMGTSNVLAGQKAGIPIYGTTAHSFLMAFASESDAFDAYARTFPESTVLLLDTYDTIEAAKKVKFLKHKVQAVRLDSGDLLELSRKVRHILNQDGLTSVKILASGDLNEQKIDTLVRAGAPIDSFGVGTELVTSYDAPALNGIYKLVEVTRKSQLYPVMKSSPGKSSYPGTKQVYRVQEAAYFTEDVITLFQESPPSPSAVSLLKCYMKDGKLVENLPSLADVRKKCLEDVNKLPPDLLDLSSKTEYPVHLSASLMQMSQAKGGGAE